MPSLAEGLKTVAAAIEARVQAIANYEKALVAGLMDFPDRPRL